MVVTVFRVGFTQLYRWGLEILHYNGGKNIIIMISFELPTFLPEFLDFKIIGEKSG